MKLLIYTHSFAPTIGGVETYAMHLARGLTNRSTRKHNEGIDVIVATMAKRGDFDDAALPFRTVRCPTLWTLLRLVQHCDVLVLAGPCLWPMFLAWVLRRPFVVEQHGYQCVCPNGMLLFDRKAVCRGHFMAKQHLKCLHCNRSLGVFASSKLWFLTFPRRWLCNHASANIAITNHVAQRLQLQKSRTIYYGVPIEPKASSCTVCSGGGAVVLCFAYSGRLVTEKGLGTLIKAAAILQQAGANFQLKFIGDGPERSVLEQQVVEYSLESRVTFTGFLAGQSLSAALSDVAVVIMPSIWEETAGLSAIEQMMRGRLVICSDIGGLGEVADGVGLKFRAGDATELAKLMRRVIDDPQVVRQLGAAARERALQLFSLERMINDHLALLSGMLNDKGFEIKALPDLR